MLDPSLLLRPWTADAVRDAGPAAASAAFLDRARDGSLPDAVLSSFGPRGVDRREVAGLARAAAESGALEPHGAGPDVALPLEVRDPVVRQILLDEWSALQAELWLASRIRRPLTVFVHAGAAAVEVPREAFERWPDLPPPLAHARPLRTAANWLALGGGLSLLDALHPELHASVAGAFFAFDI